MKRARSLIDARILTVATANLLLGTNFLYGQATHACEEAKPFSAKVVERTVVQYSDGTEWRYEFSGMRARDSRGRVYTEMPTVRIQSQTKGGSIQEYKELGDNYSPLISDCEQGESIRLHPNFKTASITKNNNELSYFDYLRRTLRQQNANVKVDDLGFRQIEGISTHGYRVTTLGTEADGEWNGKPTSTQEDWISDDLAEVVVQISSILRSKTETAIMLTGIKREEPSASLFQIPSGYRVDPPASDILPTEIKAEPNR